MNRVDGKVVIVTGGARGMGAAHARLLVREGAKVMITDILEDEGKALAAELGSAAMFMTHDVSKAEQWDRVVAETERHFGAINVLVNNAGFGFAAMLVDTAEADFRRVFEVNQLGVFLGMRAAVPALLRAGGGSIVNISSIAGLGGDVGSTAYGASKWAVTGMTKVAARELGPQAIRVNSVHPGVIDTPMIREESAHEAIRIATAGTPLNRIGTADEVANLVLFLASDESAFMNGAAVVIDGGYRL